MWLTSIFFERMDKTNTNKTIWRAQLKKNYWHVTMDKILSTKMSATKRKIMTHNNGQVQ